MINAPAYSSFSEEYSTSDLSWLADASYKEVKLFIRGNLIDQINKIKSGEEVYWVPSFVLNIVSIEYPDLYSEIYSQLLAQGFDPEKIFLIQKLLIYQ